MLLFPFKQKEDLLAVLLHSMDDIHVLTSETDTCYVFAGLGVVLLCFNIAYFPLSTCKRRAQERENVMPKPDHAG